MVITVRGDAKPVHVPPRLDNVTVTGCGRVYLYPPDLPLHGRLAGFNHYAHRVGYVEPTGDVWTAYDLGMIRLGSPASTRIEAVNRLLRQCGNSPAPAWPGARIIGRSIKEPSTAQSGDVAIDALGRVFIAAPRARSRGLRRLHELGSVWATGDRHAALPDNADSTTATIHPSQTAAVRSLLPAGAYLHARGPGSRQHPTV